MATRSLLLIAALWCAGCSLHRPPSVPKTGVLVDRHITVNNHTLSVHVADRRERQDVPLLIYATGDRGWAGKDLDVFRQLVAWGYPVAGFDAHDYVTHLAGTTTPSRVARDYEAVIAIARDTLHLSETAPVILVGVSRGAGLSVVAAGQRVLRNELHGVVAIGLTKEEEYVRWYRRIGRRRVRPPEMVEVYDYLPRLGQLPLTVIQSTRDNYLPAAAARTLFGADSERRRLIAVDARNHSFAGARREMYEALRETLGTMIGLR